MSGPDTKRSQQWTRRLVLQRGLQLGAMGVATPLAINFAAMSEAELIDLVEYLLTLKTATLSPDAWSIAGPFDNGAADAGLDRDFGPEKGVDLTATYSGKNGKVSWRTVRPTSSAWLVRRSPSPTWSRRALAAANTRRGTASPATKAASDVQSQARQSVVWSTRESAWKASSLE